MFSPQEESQAAVEPQEADVNLVRRIISRFAFTPEVDSNLPSIEKQIDFIIKEDLSYGSCAPGLSELLSSRTSRNGTIEQCLIRTAVAAIKERHTRRGRSKCVLKEEQKAMYREVSSQTWSMFVRVINNAARG